MGESERRQDLAGAFAPGVRRCGCAFLGAILVILSAVSIGQADPLHGTVRRIYDGDTVLLSDGRKVRYLGINAPEWGQPYSAKSRALNEQLVKGSRVRLELDRRERDRYGRTLAYVWKDGTMVNERLVREGLAHVWVIPPNFKHYDRLLAAQRDARAAGRGIWNKLRGDFAFIRASPADSGRPPFVRVVNVSDREADVAGHRVEDRAGHRFVFPSVTLKPGYGLIVFSGPKPGADRSGETAGFYWGTPSPAWSSEGETAVLVDPAGNIIDEFRVATKRRERKRRQLGSERSPDDFHRVLGPGDVERPETLGDDRVTVDEGREGVTVELKDLHGADRSDRGRARLSREEADLAEEVILAEPGEVHALAVDGCLDVNLAVDEDEEGRSRFPLADDFRPIVQLTQGHRSHEVLERLFGKPLEEGENPDRGVARGSEIDRRRPFAQGRGGGRKGRCRRRAGVLSGQVVQAGPRFRVRRVESQDELGRGDRFQEEAGAGEDVGSGVPSFLLSAARRREASRALSQAFFSIGFRTSSKVMD
ncbi:MAG: thermonuclease family protein [Nitrospirae bacterium]|nr:thermonuclease family protein [Nitrospirota bacterium]